MFEPKAAQESADETPGPTDARSEFDALFDDVHHLGDGHLAVVLVVDGYHGRQCTRAQAVDPFKGEQLVLGRLAVLPCECRTRRTNVRTMVDERS